MDSLFSSRAALSTLFVFEGFAVGITCLSLYAAVVRHVGWEGVIVGLALSIAIFIWWHAFSIEIDESELRYRTLLKAQRVIKLQNIKTAVRKFEIASEGNRPANRIEIYGIVDGKQVNFDINVKPFPLADVKKLEQLLHVV